MKRILLSLIAFAGVWMTAGAQVDLTSMPVPDWKNDWEIAPTTNQKFYPYNTSALKFVAKKLLDEKNNPTPFVDPDNAALWVKESDCLRTNEGLYINMSGDAVFTSEDKKTGNALEVYDYTRNFVFTYSANKKAFSIHYRHNVILSTQNGWYYMYNNGGLDVKKERNQNTDNYAQWWLINETQYDNRKAYQDYWNAVDEANKKTTDSNGQAISEASKAWRDKYLVYSNYETFKNDISGNDYTGEINSLKELVDAWNKNPEKYALLDETKAYNSDIPTGEYNAIEVVRTLKASGTWNSFCLPFSMPKSELGAGAEVKYLGSVDTDGVNYTLNFVDEEGDNLLAGKPYIVKVPTEIKVIAKENIAVDASQTPASQTFSGVQFIGNYDQMNPPVGTYVISSNKFYSVGSETTVMKGFRGYFIIPVTSGALNASFDDEDVTGITSINGNDNGNDSLYNIAGQRVNENAKGIIIKNGKKYIVK